jgi:hypothetical protein
MEIKRQRDQFPKTSSLNWIQYGNTWICNVGGLYGIIIVEEDGYSWKVKDNYGPSGSSYSFGTTETFGLAQSFVSDVINWLNSRE